MRTMVGLRFYNMDMVQYTKKAITILDQIQNLEDKGLKFFDVELAKIICCLLVISDLTHIFILSWILERNNLFQIQHLKP